MASVTPAAHDSTAQRIATVADVLWRTIFGDAVPSTALGRTIACDVAARRLAAAGLLADIDTAFVPRARR